MTNTKEAAKLIRRELRAKFPKSKFSVLMNGQAVYVRYDPSVTREQIRMVTDKYEDSKFNPVEDYWETSIHPTRPQASYVLLTKTY